jgi:hypothetical protein
MADNTIAAADVRPDPIEVLFGNPYGLSSTVEPLESGATGARQALEDSVLEGLRRPPCIVSFSGGRDSSLVLAVATHVARREGLPLPVPVTLWFHDDPDADESRWQEQLIRHLGLPDWERLERADLGFLGPVARAGLREHGLLWPANAFFHAPIIEVARGGTVLTGIDGDGLFAGWRWGQDALAARGFLRTVRRDVLERSARHLPDRLLRHLAPRLAWRPRWVEATAWPELAMAQLRRTPPVPRRWDAWVRSWWRGRALAATRTSYRLLGEAGGARVVHPLLDPTFVAAVAGDGGHRGLGSRRSAMVRLGGDLLPDAVVTRTTKAFFDAVFWDQPTREWLTRWDGTGVDRAVVDADRLRDEWRRPRPHFGSALLAQQAWLSSDGR